jgi:hypothetical protein
MSKITAAKTATPSKTAGNSKAPEKKAWKAEDYASLTIPIE